MYLHNIVIGYMLVENYMSYMFKSEGKCNFKKHRTISKISVHTTNALNARFNNNKISIDFLVFIKICFHINSTSTGFMIVINLIF